MTTMQNSLINNANARQADANTRHTNLITQLQTGFDAVNDNFAINLSSVRDILYGVEDNLNDYLVKGSGGVITALQDISTKLDQDNTTGNISQSQLLSSLADLQKALLISNVSSTDNTVAIEQLQIIMGSMSSMPGIAVPGASSSSASGASTSGPTPAQVAVSQALLTAQTAQAAAAAAAQKAINDTDTQKAINDSVATAAVAQKAIDDAASAQKAIDDAAAGLPPTTIAIPGASGVSTILAPVSPTGGIGAAGGFLVKEHPEITTAKIKAGTQKDLTITQNKELLASLYTEYPEIFARINY